MCDENGILFLRQPARSPDNAMDTTASTSTATHRPLKRRRLNERVDTPLICLDTYQANDAYINKTFKIRALGVGDGTFRDSWSQASTFDTFVSMPRDTKIITKLDMSVIAQYINDFVKDDFSNVKVKQSTVVGASRSVPLLPAWSAIQQSLGRFADQANRFQGLLYHSTVGIFGQIRTQPSWGWLTWRGEKLSRNQQIKYATSLDAGNILRAIGTIRGQWKQQSTIEGRNKLDRLTSELVKRCVFPAQQYIAKKLGDLNWTADKPVILKLIISWVVVKPRMCSVFLCPAAFWDNTGMKGWRGHIEMYIKNLSWVKTSFPQLPIISMCSLAFEDVGVIAKIFDASVKLRKDYNNTSARYYKDHSLGSASEMKWIAPPLKVSPSGGFEEDKIFLSGVTIRHSRQNRDNVDFKTLLSMETYASVDDALQAINSRITEGSASFKVRSARESWRLDAQGHFDWNQTIETTIDPVGFNFFQRGRANR